MPSAKPDKNEIKLPRRKRGLYKSPLNLFSGLFLECRLALEGGYITPERGKRLLAFLDNNAHVAAIFPNNLLRRLLVTSLTRDQWSLEIEAVLLDFIAQLYLGTRIEDRVPIGVTLSVGSNQPF